MATYFSSSGGATDNSENVWVEARPYLRSVNEIAEFNPMQWTRTLTWAELTTLAQTANANIGTVTGLAVSSISASGRVQELTLQGTNGNHAITGERIRTFFNTSTGGMLQSRNFHLQNATAAPLTDVSVYDGYTLITAPLSSLRVLDLHENTHTPRMAYIYNGIAPRRIQPAPHTVTGGTGVTITGSGWGHGVGMSQHGAEGMARAGFTYRQILLHYFTGVEIR